MKKLSGLSIRLSLVLCLSLLLTIFVLLPAAAAEAPSDSAAKKPLIVSNEKIRTMDASTDEYLIMATVENPNDTWYVYQTRYTFDMFNASGAPVFEDTPLKKNPEYKIHIIPPHAKVNLFAPTKKGSSVTQVKLVIKYIRWENLSGLLPEFEVTNLNIQNNPDSFTSLKGNINAKTDSEYMVWAIATIYDSAGNMVNGRLFELTNVGKRPTEMQLIVWGKDAKQYSKYSLQIMAARIDSIMN